MYELILIGEKEKYTKASQLRMYFLENKEVAPELKTCILVLGEREEQNQNKHIPQNALKTKKAHFMRPNLVQVQNFLFVPAFSYVYGPGNFKICFSLKAKKTCLLSNLLFVFTTFFFHS